MFKMKYIKDRIQSRLDITENRRVNMKTYQWILSRRKHWKKKITANYEMTLSSIIHATRATKE